MTAKVALCLVCNTKYPTPEQRLEHLNALVMDTAMLHALVVIHGRREGLRRYLEIGVLHMTEAEFRVEAEKHGIQIND